MCTELSQPNEIYVRNIVGIANIGKTQQTVIFDFVNRGPIEGIESSKKIVNCFDLWHHSDVIISYIQISTAKLLF